MKTPDLILATSLIFTMGICSVWLYQLVQRSLNRPIVKMDLSKATTITVPSDTAINFGSPYKFPIGTKFYYSNIPGQWENHNLEAIGFSHIDKANCQYIAREDRCQMWVQMHGVSNSRQFLILLPFESAEYLQLEVTVIDNGIPRIGTIVITEGSRIAYIEIRERDDYGVFFFKSSGQKGLSTTIIQYKVK